MCIRDSGYGHPVNPVGLIFSAFRPSDDATTFGFLVPSNMFAIVSLRQLAEISKKVTRDNAFADECSALADEVEAVSYTHLDVYKRQLPRPPLLIYHADGPFEIYQDKRPDTFSICGQYAKNALALLSAAM